jgi:NRAMP (natural resistance-associated macrophage protein)-like metal ion transporter
MPGEKRKPGALRKLVRVLGPGLIAGTADDDPAGITTYSQAGAAFQYGLLWTALLQIPLMCAIQLTCARIGLVSGRDLTGVLREHYPRWVLWFVCAILLVANTVTAAADIDGMAAGAELLTGIPALWFVPVFSLLLILLIVFASYRTIANVFKWLTLALFGYLLAGVLAKPDWGEVLYRTFVPGITWSHEYLVTFVGVFGTTISPYLFVWQSAEEVEEDKAKGRGALAERKGATRAELNEVLEDTVTGMTVSQIICYFIVIAAGSVLYPTGQRDIESARQAAQALHPVGGGLGTILFSVGLIGTGMLGVPTLVGSSAYALAAVKGWRAGINETARQAKGFYAALVVGMLVAAAIDFARINPVTLLFGSAVLNGVLAPPLLVVILLVANNPTIMKRRTNGRLLNVLGVITLMIMSTASLWLAVEWVLSKTR